VDGCASFAIASSKWKRPMPAGEYVLLAANDPGRERILNGRESGFPIGLTLQRFDESTLNGGMQRAGIGEDGTREEVGPDPDGCRRSALMEGQLELLTALMASSAMKRCLTENQSS